MNDNLLGKKGRKKIVRVVCVVLFLTVACVVYICTGHYDSIYTMEQYQKNDNVTMDEHKDYIAIKSDCENVNTAFIFYPGAKVAPSAYIPLMKLISEGGVDCYIVKMPCDFAILGIDKANDLIAEYEEQYKQWYIGGHSLGAAMACEYADGHSDKLNGVILLAGYSTKDLTDDSMKVLSLYGSNDGVLSFKSLEKYKGNLPADTIYKELSGGNHAQFGDYGVQRGDKGADITAEKQWEWTASNIETFMFP